jgi:serine/threonine protein kinase
LEDFLLMPRYISTLADLKPLTPERQGLLLAQVTAALQYLHGKGVAHMDVKPDNIAMNQSGDFILIDIGNAAPVRTLADVSSMFVPGGFDIVQGRLMTFLARLDFKCIQTNGKALHLSPHDALEALRKLECVVCESLSALVCNTAVCER